MGLVLSGSRAGHPLFSMWKAAAASNAAGVCVAVSGSLDELIRAACRGVVATHAVFPVIEEDGPLLTIAERDYLWQLWQVPVYTMIQDHDGRVVASECEAQEGMHVSGLIPSAGTVVSAPCECGRPGNRWTPGRTQASSAA